MNNFKFPGKNKCNNRSYNLLIENTGHSNTPNSGHRHLILLPKLKITPHQIFNI